MTHDKVSSRYRWGTLVVIGVAVAAAAAQVMGQANRNPDPATLQRRDPGRELANKITAPFTVATVGDFLAHDPISQMADQRLLDVIRAADIGFANMETHIIDKNNFPTAWGGNFAPKELAADIKAAGIDLMSQANNHTFDLNEQGMFSTFDHLDKVGIVSAGTGRHLTDARTPRFLQTPKGRVGLAAMYAISDPPTSGGDRMMATARVGDMGGKPGLNGLRLQVYSVVTAEHMEALRRIRDAVYSRRDEVPNPVEPVSTWKEPPDTLQMFERWFKVGPKPGEYSYAMNQGDLRDILVNIKNGKWYGDFLIVNIHTHQNRYAFQHYTYDHYPPEFLVELAHQAVDNGADVFVAQGVHSLRGIEIYKGKPIFYGLSNFVFHENMLIESAQGYVAEGENPFTTTKTAAEIAEVNTAWLQVPTALEALLATSRFENGQLAEVRLYPVDVGQEGRPTSRMGIPMTPSPAMAQRVLQKLQTFSKPFGTTITIEGNIGVIRPVPAKTSGGAQ